MSYTLTPESLICHSSHLCWGFPRDLARIKAVLVAVNLKCGRSSRSFASCVPLLNTFLIM